MARPAVEFTGDFAHLQEYAAKLAKLKNANRIIAKNLAEEAIGLVREGFERSQDPYGKPWSYPIFRDGRPLEDTGGLKASWKRRYTTRGFTVSSTKKYASYLQSGTGLYGPRKQRVRPTNARALRIPVRGGSPIFRRSVAGMRARKMVPKAGYIPRRWSQRFVTTANDVIHELLR